LPEHAAVLDGNTPFYFLMEFATESVREFKESPTLAVPPVGAPKMKKWPDLFPPVASAQSDAAHGT